IMRHCVYSYYDRINNGSCAIYSIISKKNPKDRWTLQLDDGGMGSSFYGIGTTKTYRIAQLRGVNNYDPPKEVTNEVNRMVAIANQKQNMAPTEEPENTTALE